MSIVDLDHLAHIGCQAAWEAGSFLKSQLGRHGRIHYKGPTSLVTKVDRRSEDLIYAIIHQAFPEHAFLGEERIRKEQPSPFRWFVDPLDGTTNYIHGMPLFSVSIALEHEGVLILGIVYDPMREEMFLGKLGGGSSLNGRPMRVSRVRRLQASLLSTGFPERFRHNPKPFLRRFEAFQKQTHAVRRLGSAALNLAYVAAGWLDGFWEEDIHPWDLAAGMVLIQEAGGETTDFTGAAMHPFSKQMVASNGRIHRQMLTVLGQT